MQYSTRNTLTKTGKNSKSSMKDSQDMVKWHGKGLNIWEQEKSFRNKIMSYLSNL